MAKRTCDPTSGKIGNQIYFEGRNGQVVRTRVIPANPKSNAQSNVRADFKTASALWDTIGQVKQLAWIAAAAAFQSKARLGMSGPLTGNQYFVKVNANLLGAGSSTVTDPPAAPSFTDLPVTALTATNPAGVGTLIFSATGTWPVKTVLLGAAPQKNGVHRVPQMVELGAATAIANSASNCTSLYSARFGNPATGSKVFLGLKQTTGGFDGVLMTFSAVIPASS